MTPKDPADGLGFYGCPDTACRFMLNVGCKKHKDPCPSCGGVVLERWRNPKAGPPESDADRFWGCGRYPTCRFTHPWKGPQPTSAPG
jgi:ssDNA-binding Zn-finger/Zn-ribbon topoisomerase 1